MSTDLRKENSRKRNRIPFLVLLIILAVILVSIVLMMPRRSGPQSNDNELYTDVIDDGLEKWQEGIISYEGKDYIYNQDIKTYLIMGIDKDGKVEAETDYTKGGQSDAMFLLVTDASDKTISIISIHRNTMTRIETCSVEGKVLGYKEAQICIQHGYGDGKNLSCVRSVDAVSYLFYNLPIQGYLAMNMGGLPTMNDGVGGVEVTVLDDLSSVSRGVNLKKGQTITLDGDEAYIYLRGRDTDEFDSATNRLKRQEQYITAYMKKLETIAARDTSAAVEIYESLSDYMVSSIDFASLVSEISDYSYTAEQMYSIPGEVVMGKVYEEYHVDEDAFYEMILDIFYLEVTE